MKVAYLKILSVLFIFFLASCGKDDKDVTPKDQMEGTWKVDAAVVTDADGSLDIWSLLKAFYPCASDITYTFKDGKYTSNVPSGCADEDGDTLSLLSATGGTYSVSEGSFTVDIDGEPLTGDITFSGNTAVVSTVDPDDPQANLKITFVKQ